MVAFAEVGLLNRLKIWGKTKEQWSDKAKEVNYARLGVGRHETSNCNYDWLSNTSLGLF